MYRLAELGRFAGVALIAGGLGMILPNTTWPMTTQLAAFLSGIMIFIWVLSCTYPGLLLI